jgi:hypothetical protein
MPGREDPFLGDPQRAWTNGDQDRGDQHHDDGEGERVQLDEVIANLYYRWSKEFLEAGKKRLAGDTAIVSSLLLNGLR